MESTVLATSIPPRLTSILNLSRNVKKHAQNMPLVIEGNFTPILKEKPLTGELDIVIIALPFPEHGVPTSPVYNKPFVALLPVSHPLKMNPD